MIPIPKEEEVTIEQETRDYGNVSIWIASWTPPGTIEGTWRAMIEWCHDGPLPTDLMHKALRRQAYLRLIHSIHAHNRYEEQNA